MGGELLHVLAPIALAAIVAALVWRLFRNRYRLWRIRHRGGHLVIAGDENLLPIVVGEHRAGNPAIVLAEPRTRMARIADRIGSPQLARDCAGGIGRYLRKARMILLSGADDDNVAMAATILGEAGTLHDRGLPLPMIVRVDDTSRHAAVEASLAARGGDGALHVRLISLPALIARAILRSDMLDRVHRGGLSSRLLVVLGFTAITERYLLDLLVGAHVRDGRPLDVIVVDRDAAADRAGFLARWPFAARLTVPTFVACDITDNAAVTRLIETLIDDQGVPAAMVIDAVTEAASIAVLDAVDAVLRARDLVPPAYAVHAGLAVIAHIAAPVLAFGGANIADYRELLLHEKHEELGRAIHDFYLEGRLDEGERLGSRAALHDWDALPEAIRDNNRLLVDLYGIKLRDIGARIVAGRGASLAFEPAELAELAHAEHDRWLASRRLAGWDWGEARDDAHRRHPDLVPHDRLDEARAERNRAQVRIVTRLLSRVGQHAVRDLRVLVERETARDIEVAAETLRAAYPDRALVFVGDIEDERVRAALGIVHAAGALVQLAITRHPDALLATLHGDRAAVARALLAAADRLHVPAPGQTVADLLASLAGHRLGDGAAHGRHRRHAAAAR